MLQMGIYKYNIYRTPNIGIFLKVNDKFLLAPKGLANTKINKLESFLGVKCINVSIAHTRLLGPLMAMNNNTIILPRIIDEIELEEFKAIGLDIILLDIKQTALGNLIVMNDKGAVVASTIPKDVINMLKDRLGIEVIPMQLGEYYQVGAMIVATNNGAAVHPNITDDELKVIMDVLKVYAEPSTVNGGVPFLSSGLVANSNNVVVGELTTGPELVMLSRAFKV
ncbi:MAG: translation initiation factor IF-6 [Candidatus Nitrosocaldaceae archaeon]|nr:MAG: translation initiation factor IF-6 [Candidatus Nitrosocaldaceae archaeon]